MGTETISRSKGAIPNSETLTSITSRFQSATGRLLVPYTDHRDGLAIRLEDRRDPQTRDHISNLFVGSELIEFLKRVDEQGFSFTGEPGRLSFYDKQSRQKFGLEIPGIHLRAEEMAPAINEYLRAEQPLAMV